MRGIKIIHDVVYELEVHAETLAQGQAFETSLTLKTTGDRPHPIKAYISLALATLKKVRADDPCAFKILETHFFSYDDNLKTHHCPFKLPLKLQDNCPITDNTHSLFMLYGEKENLFGHLQLTVTPHPLHQEILSVWEIFLRFKMKSRRSRKQSVEYKLLPPPGKTYTGLKVITLLLEKIGDNLVQQIHCDLEQIDYSGVSVEGGPKTKKVDKSVTLTLAPSDYLIYGDSFNQNNIKTILEKTLQEILPTSF